MAALPTAGVVRSRVDRCPGVLRPWPAEDGALLRIRLVGGRLRRDQLAGLAGLAGRYGDGRLYLTARANVQVRAVALPVPDPLVTALEGLGLLPSRTHERVRNIMVSPLTGRVGGHADLRPAAEMLDAALCADPVLAGLPARFLFGLDDRGDLQRGRADLEAVAVGPDRARLWAGGLAGEVVDLPEVPGRLVALARRFRSLRGEGPTAAWHVAELPGGGADLGRFQAPADLAAPADAAPIGGPRPTYGPVPQHDGRHARHLAVPDGVLTPDLLGEVLAAASAGVVVTPWHSLLLTDLETLR